MTPAAALPSQLNTTAILLVLALGTFILGLSEFSMMPMLPLISETFSSTPSQSGYAISAYAIGVVVGAPILMLTTANMKKRHALAIFLTLMFISNGLSAMATSLEQLIVFRFLSGLPHGAYFGAAILLAAGGLGAFQAAAIVAGFPFALVVFVMMYALLRGLSRDRLILYRNQQKFITDESAEHNSANEFVDEHLLQGPPKIVSGD